MAQFRPEDDQSLAEVVSSKDGEAVFQFNQPNRLLSSLQSVDLFSSIFLPA